MQGLCEYYDLKKKCSEKVCCFDCNKKCEYKNDRCFEDSLKRSRILKGYPKVCRFYTNKG